MRAAFFGTPSHAVPALAALCDAAEVSLVVTQPDRARGRRGYRVAPPVKEAASEWGIPVAQPERAGDLEETLDGLDLEVAVVVAFGQLIPPALLQIPRAGFVNVHFSLLPRWRGASPVVRAILAGDRTTGVTLMQMDEGLDTGPVLAAEQAAIGPRESAGTLTARLAWRGAALLRGRLQSIAAGELEPRVQDDERATAARRVRVEEAFVDPRRHSAAAVDRAVRAFDPRPGAWSTVDGRRLKLWRVLPTEAPGPEPGIVAPVGDRVLLGARDGALEVVELQPEGKARMTAVEWMRGRRGAAGRLEPPTPRSGR